MNEQNVRINLARHALWAPAMVAIALVVSVAIAAYTFYVVRGFDDSLSVTGSAVQAVTSDHVKWGGQITRPVTTGNLKSGYDALARDKAAVESFLAQNGIATSSVTESAVFMDEDYSYNANNYGGEKHYNLRQTFEIQSDDVERISALAKNIQGLINQGVIFSTYALEYTYSNLADLRISLLSAAVKDAKARAEEIATASGKHVGQLKSAASGVVQVLSQNSTEVSDYGSYDTSTINKNVMVTVKTSFTLR
jgi:hypothetical protein